MIGMFKDCSLLKKLNTSNFNTNKIEDMSEMFQNCSSLTSLALSHFKITNVETMQSIFAGCSSLKDLNISNFNLDNILNKDSLCEILNGCTDELKMKVNQFNNFKIIEFD